MKVKKTGLIQIRIGQETKDKVEKIISEKYKQSLSEFIREKLEEVLR